MEAWKIAVIVLIILDVLLAIGCIIVGSILIKKLRQMGRIPKRQGLRAWWQAHKPTKRRLIQVYVALLYNANIKGFISGQMYKGPLKNLCVPGLNCYSCPGAAGACPLGALQNAFAQSGTRAPYYVLGIILLFGIILGRTICGFLCPVGLGQELLYKIKTPKLKKSKVTYILSYLKYVLLAVFVVAIPLLYSYRQTAIPAFCKYICPAGTFGGALGLLIHPTNANYLEGLGGLFTWKFVVMVAVIAACMFIYRFFCRFFCPLGALYGFFNKIAMLGVKLEKDKCTDCGLCVSFCKMDIRHVGDHECINCGECINICPSKAIRWKGSKLFVHANAVEAVEAAPGEEKPLNGILNYSAPVATASPLPADTGMGSADMVATDAVVDTSAVPTARQKKKRGKAFWLQVGAWVVALLFLGGVLVYYNFIDGAAVPPPVTAVETQCTFTVRTLSGNAGLLSFTVSEEGTTADDYAIPTDGDGTEEKPYVLEDFTGIYDIFVAANTTVYYTFKTTTNAYTVSSKSDDLSLILYAYEDDKLVTVAEIVGAEEVSFSFADFITPTGNQVGYRCFDFTTTLYSDKGSFTLSEHRGKIVIVNFWYTSCGPCVTELPEFERIKTLYGDAVEVIAIHSAMIITEDVQNYLNTKRDVYDSSRVWRDYGILFAQDTGKDSKSSDIYDLLVADANYSYPATLILDEEGIVRFRLIGSMTYDTLVREVDAILGK